MMAEEVGMDGTCNAACCDIGKAADHEVDGGATKIGALLK